MTREEQARTAKKVLPKAGLSSFISTEMQNSTFVFRLNVSAKNPAFGNTRNVGCNFDKNCN